MCRVRSCFFPSVAGQAGHWKGRSPRWTVRTCWRRLYAVAGPMILVLNVRNTRACKTTWTYRMRIQGVGRMRSLAHLSFYAALTLSASAASAASVRRMERGWARGLLVLHPGKPGARAEQALPRRRHQPSSRATSSRSFACSFHRGRKLQQHLLEDTVAPAARIPGAMSMRRCRSEGIKKG